MNTREAVRRLREMGVPVEEVRRTGEMRVRRPDGLFIAFAHPTRRKDASRALTVCVRAWEVQRGVR